jgi:hypothetical protein
MEKRDPIEDTPEFKEIVSEIDAQAHEEALGSGPISHGFCRIFWRAKQRILKTKYGIDWKSPADMNPQIEYD